VARILLVEDEPSDLELMRTLLRDAGHVVVYAQDGKEALEALRRETVEVVITDLRMPVVNGLRLIRSLRASGDTIPIIAVSGKNADQLMLAEDYGANAGLTKPLDRDELLSVLNKVLSDNRDRWTDAWIHPEFGSVGDR